MARLLAGNQTIGISFPEKQKSPICLSIAPPFVQLLGFEGEVGTSQPFSIWVPLFTGQRADCR